MEIGREDCHGVEIACPFLAPPRERFSSQELPHSLSLAFAGFAIIGGAVSYLRREDHRYAYVACGVGTVTLVWHTLILALAVAVLCVILHYVLPDALS